MDFEMSDVKRLCRLCLEPEKNETFARILEGNSKTSVRIFVLIGIEVNNKEMKCFQI
jgi:hypothetical protein